MKNMTQNVVNLPEDKRVLLDEENQGKIKDPLVRGL